jgi:hypothetical protein
MPDQVGCLPFFPVMPHNHSSPGQGGQLDEMSWGRRLTEIYYALTPNTNFLGIYSDTEKYTNDTSGAVLKEIKINSLNTPNLIHHPILQDNLRFSFDIMTSNNSYQATAGIYINNTLVGTLQTTTSTSYTTKIQDLNIDILKPNDVIQLIGLIADPSARCYIRNFRLYFATTFYFFKNINFYDNNPNNRLSSGFWLTPFSYSKTIE